MLNAADLVNLLEKVYIFKDIGYPLHGLAGKMQLSRFDKGSVIYKEGDEGSCLYLVSAGKVLVYTVLAGGREMPIETIEQPGFFGEMSLLDGGRRPAWARALEDTVCFCLYRQDFLDFLKENLQVSLKIIENLSRKLRQADYRLRVLTVLGSRHPERKVHLPDALSGVSPDAPDSGQEDGFFEGMLEKHLEDAAQDAPAGPGKDEVEVKDMLFYKKYACPICESKFDSPKVRSKYLRVQKIDNDYCKHYETVNPLFYEIMVCPACGFAFDESILNTRLSPGQKEKVKGLLATVWRSRPLKEYGGERSLEQAVETFLLALLCIESIPVKMSKKGMLYLKAAWLFRFKGDEEKELKYIKKAAACLEQAYEKEDFIDPKSELNIVYLIAILNMRAGNNQEATRWMERILRHPAKSAATAVINQAREAWAELRQRVRQEQEMKV